MGMFTLEMCCILLLQYVLSFAVVKFILIPFIREYDFAFVYFLNLCYNVKYAAIAQSVERIHGKDEVTSSNLVRGSIFLE